MAESKTLVISIMTPGVSKGAGGFVVINGKLKRIPPNTPKLKDLAAAFSVLQQTEDIADKKMRSQLNDITESLIAAHANSLVEEIGK